MADGTTTLDWVRPLPQQVRARCETALWWLGIPAVLWAVVAQLWVSWAWIPAGLTAVWLVLVLATARAHVRAQAWACTEDALVARRGWLWQSVRSVPWSRVRSVELSEGPIESRLGLASLVVKIPGLGLPVGGLAVDRARELRAEVLTRARRPLPGPAEETTDAPDRDAPDEVPPGVGPDAPDGEAPDEALPGVGLDVPDEAPDGLVWFRAHPLSGVASWVSTLLWLGAFALYFLLRESEDVPSILGALGRFSSDPRFVVGACVVVVLVVLGAVWSEVVRRRTTWALGRAEVHERFTGRTRRHAVVPLERVDRVDLASSVGERVFGLARLTVMTAAGDDSTVIGAIPRAQAEQLRGRIMDTSDEVTPSDGAHGQGPDLQPEPGDARAEAGEGSTSGPRSSQAGDARAEAGGRRRGPGEVIAVTDRRMVVRAFVVRDLVLPAAVAGGVGVLVALVTGTSALLFPALGVLAFAGRRVWRVLDASVGRTVSTTADGLVVASGLGTRTERTLRRGRTHAVRLSRRPAWWGADLWTVTALSGASDAAAEEEDDDDDEVAGALVTVADSRAAFAVAHEALPDLSRVDRRLLRDVWPAADGVVVPDPAVDGAPVSVLRVPDRAWWLHPVTWRVRVAALVADGLLVRTGWLAPRVTFVPLRHVQGVTLDEGPLLRRAGVVAVDVHLVEGPVKVSAGPLEPAAARHLAEVLARAAAAPMPRPGDRLDRRVPPGGRMGA